MPNLSVLIPARQERWLSRTVQDVCEHKQADTDVIVVLDGAWPDKGHELVQHPDVHVIYLPEPIGQRAATNLAARTSTAPYVMKLDAHCSVSAGFDMALLEATATLERAVIQIPVQRHLHVYDQVCECGFRADQAPHLADCPQCHGPLRQEVVWEARQGKRTTAWRFDADLHFQYRGIQQDDVTYPETMSCLGACWFLNREWFWELGGLDETHGSWGQMGTELACKAWLSGGRMVTNTRCEFSHFFRVGGIGFPYEIHGSDQEKAREYSRNLWRSNAWPGQVKPLRWLVEKFRPEGWSQEQIDALPATLVLADAVVPPVADANGRGVGADAVAHDVPRLHAGSGGVLPGLRRSASGGVVYYSDCRPSADILDASRRSIEASGFPVVAVTLTPIDWPAAKNIVLPLERGVLTMFRQILAGLEALDTEYAFLAEHDVLYHRSHWAFVPPNDSTFFYNEHVWKVSAEDGRALHYRCNQTSGLCASRALLIEHYRKRVAHVERHGYSRNNGFEPGTRKLRHGGFDDSPFDVWRSEFPNIDVRHTFNLTPSRWRKEEFKNQRYTEGWVEGDSVPGWGKTAGRFTEFLADLSGAHVAV